VTAPLVLYDAALRRAARGAEAVLRLVDRTGRAVQELDAHRYTAQRPGDGSIVDGCVGPTLDLGCGPGRLAAALTARGTGALGVDISATAVRAARRRGAPAVRADLFGPLPGEGTWRHVLLADGNIGIGGDPVRLLARCAALRGPDGDVLVECEPPGARSWHGPVALVNGSRISTPFPWAYVSVADLGTVAAAAGLSPARIWTEAGRWFARLR
jgi:SAM-dependent methyltransferase